MELYVYVCIHVEDDLVGVPVIISIGANEDQHARVLDSWSHFDANACECFSAEDKTRILAVVQQHPGGVHCFNAHVKAPAASILNFTTNSTDRFNSRGISKRSAPRVISKLSGSRTTSKLSTWSNATSSVDIPKWSILLDAGTSRLLHASPHELAAAKRTLSQTKSIGSILWGVVG